LVWAVATSGSAAFTTPTPAAAASPTFVRSTFLDPRTALNWNSERWGAEFDAFHAAGIDTVVLGATIDLTGGTVKAYYPCNVAGAVQAKNDSGQPLDIPGRVLALAKDHGMQVWLGLYRDSGRVRFTPDSSIKKVLLADAAITRQLAADLWRVYHSDAGTIAGWYLPTEVNTNYTRGPARSAIQSYYATLSRWFSSRFDRKPVMISPYFNARAGVSAKTWTKFWTQTLKKARIGVLALQDGAGDIPGEPRSRKELDKTLRTWFSATKKAVKDARTKTKLWSNLDLYDFTGASATVGDVAANAKAVRSYVRGYTSFSFSSQYSPRCLGTDRYAKVFGAWNRSGKLPAGRPSTPEITNPGSVGRARSATRTVEWAASTPTSGAEIAFYRLFDAKGTYVATAWSTSATIAATGGCLSVIAYDVAGHTSRAANAC
jgi:hypothetical protein